MKQLSKVVWSEGMHLAPHHFQLQSRYFEDSIRFALASLFGRMHRMDDQLMLLAPLAREARARATPVCAKTIRFISGRASNARSRCGNSMRSSNRPPKA